jgi:hypothetical protein
MDEVLFTVNEFEFLCKEIFDPIPPLNITEIMNLQTNVEINQIKPTLSTSH